MAEHDAIRDDAAPCQFRVHLCFGPNCTERGSRALLPVLLEAVQASGLADRVEILATTCRNRCDYGPSMNVYPGPIFYNDLDSEAIIAIVDEHLDRGAIVERHLFKPKVNVQRGIGRRKPDW